MRAVSNAGPLIHLSWIDHLHLLPILFDQVVIPTAVRDEVLRAGPDVPGVAAIRDAVGSWLTTQQVADPTTVEAMTGELDLGEAEAIALVTQVRETPFDILLLDDGRARDHARRANLPLTGTIGVLRLARDRHLIPAVMPLLEELRQRGFRISAALVEQIRVEEMPLSPRNA